jgi:hypothetical protein
LGRKYVAFHRCGNCGCVVGWLPRGDYPECAVNARMLDGFDLDAVTLIVEEDGFRLERDELSLNRGGFP